MKRSLAIALVAFAAASLPAAAIDFGGLIGKAIDAGTKLKDANRDFTQDEEIQLGDGIAATMLGAYPLSKDANLQRYVNRVGRWVALHSDRPDLPWTFGVIEAPTVNAFAMPGGTILVSKGLVDRLGSESELAGALAHEIAHVVLKHQLAAIRSSANADVWASIGSDVAADRIANTGGGGVVRQVASGPIANLAADAIKNGVFLRPLDRSMEYDADRMGVILATRAGYDPYGLPGVLEVLGTMTGDGSGIDIMATHPAPSDRLAELEKVMPAVEGYSNQPRLEGRFLKVVGRAK
jgi:predicted Zn-dependent protease